MGAIASQITSLTIVYSIVYSDADPRTDGQLRGKCFHLMTSSWKICSFMLTLHMASEILVKTGSSNGLLLGGAKALQTNVDLSSLI